MGAGAFSSQSTLQRFNQQLGCQPVDQPDVTVSDYLRYYTILEVQAVAAFMTQQDNCYWYTMALPMNYSVLVVDALMKLPEVLVVFGMPRPTFLKTNQGMLPTMV
jgi:hypothetical protein